MNWSAGLWWEDGLVFYGREVEDEWADGRKSRWKDGKIFPQSKNVRRLLWDTNLDFRRTVLLRADDSFEHHVYE